MPGFPGYKPYLGVNHVLSTIGANSPLGDISIVGGILSRTNTAWTTTNLAKFFAFQVDIPCVAQKMAYICGTNSGNGDIGIYDLAGNRLVSSGSTAVVSGINVLDITDTALSPGTYLAAIAFDNTTVTVQRWVMSSSSIGGTSSIFGKMQMATAFTLPATATLAIPTDTGVVDITISATAVF